LGAAWQLAHEAPALGWENFQLWPASLWHVVHDPALCFAGRLWHDAQSLELGCENFQLWPVFLWHVEHAWLL